MFSPLSILHDISINKDIVIFSTLIVLSIYGILIGTIIKLINKYNTISTQYTILDDQNLINYNNYKKLMIQIEDLNNLHMEMMKNQHNYYEEQLEVQSNYYKPRIHSTEIIRLDDFTRKLLENHDDDLLILQQKYYEDLITDMYEGLKNSIIMLQSNDDEMMNLQYNYYESLLVQQREYYKIMYLHKS